MGSSYSVPDFLFKQCAAATLRSSLGPDALANKFSVSSSYISDLRTVMYLFADEDYDSLLKLSKDGRYKSTVRRVLLELSIPIPPDYQEQLMNNVCERGGARAVRKSAPSKKRANKLACLIDADIKDSDDSSAPESAMVDCRDTPFTPPQDFLISMQASADLLGQILSEIKEMNSYLRLIPKLAELAQAQVVNDDNLFGLVKTQTEGIKASLRKRGNAHASDPR